MVQELPLYDTVYQPAGALDLSAEFQKHPETLAVFTSASTVGALPPWQRAWT